MRIVAVADTHTFQADLGRIPDGDVFVHAGDFCRFGSVEELAPTADWIRELPHAHKVVIAGNHDWCFVDSLNRVRALLGDQVRYLQDTGTAIDGVSFWGSPWQPEFGGWAFNLPRGRPIAEKWALIPQGTDVLITHGPPSGFGDRCSVGGREGCEDLLHAIERVAPKLHLYGHIHEDGGQWVQGASTLANVTTWEGERAPTVFDMDARTKRVTVVHVPPRAG